MKFSYQGLRLLFVACFVVATLCLGWIDSSVGQQAATLSNSTSRNLETEEKLSEVISVAFDDTPFTDVQEFLTRELDVDFILTQSAKDDSLTKDDKIDFVLNLTPAYSVLEFMLAEANATYVIRDGVVFVISLDDAEAVDFLRTKMYNCNNLINAMKPCLQPPAVMQGGVFAIGGKLKPQLGGQLPDDQAPVPQREPNEDEIFHCKSNVVLDMIGSTIAPGSWDDTNGDCSRQIVGGVLIVTQTEANLRKVENLLKDLHATMGVEPPPAPQMAELNQ